MHGQYTRAVFGILMFCKRVIWHAELRARWQMTTTEFELVQQGMIGAKPLETSGTHVSVVVERCDDPNAVHKIYYAAVSRRGRHLEA